MEDKNNKNGQFGAAPNNFSGTSGAIFGNENQVNSAPSATVSTGMISGTSTPVGSPSPIARSSAHINTRRYRQNNPEFFNEALRQKDQEIIIQDERKAENKKKFIIGGVTLGVVALVAIIVVVLVSFSNNQSGVAETGDYTASIKKMSEVVLRDSSYDENGLSGELYNKVVGKMYDGGDDEMSAYVDEISAAYDEIKTQFEKIKENDSYEYAEFSDKITRLGAYVDFMKGLTNYKPISERSIYNRVQSDSASYTLAALDAERRSALSTDNEYLDSFYITVYDRADALAELYGYIIAAGCTVGNNTYSCIASKGAEVQNGFVEKNDAYEELRESDEVEYVESIMIHMIQDLESENTENTK